MIQVHAFDQRIYICVFEVAIQAGVSNELLLTKRTPAMAVCFLASGRIELVANGVEVAQKLALEVKSRNANTFDLVMTGSFTTTMAALALTIVEALLPPDANGTDKPTVIWV